MYDTIGIISPGLDHKTYRKIKKICMRREGYEIETGELKYQITTGSLEGSFDSRLSIQVRTWKFEKNEAGVPSRVNTEPHVYIECSVHKLIMGHNIYGGPVVFHKACEFLTRFTERAIGVQLPSYLEWVVARVDVAECYRLPSFEACSEWFRGMNNSDYPRRTVMRFGNSGIYSPGYITTVKFYHKGPEFYKHDRKRLKNTKIDIDDNYRCPGCGQENRNCNKCLNVMEKDIEKQKVKHMNYIDKLQVMANNIIRAEVEIKRRKFKADFGQDVKVQEVTDSYLAGMYDIEVQKMLREGAEGMEKVKNNNDVEQRIIEVYGNRVVNNLLGFWVQMSLHGEKVCKEKYAKSVFYRNRKRLVDAGIVWAGTDMVLVENSIIPADFSPVRGNVYQMPINEDIEKRIERLLMAI